MARVVIVTGMSGAGRASCLKVLEDLDFEAIDNVPVTLLGRLLGPHEPPARALAVGIDIRTRAFEPAGLVARLAGVLDRGGGRPTLLFLDCDDEILTRRFTETRRRHPLAADRPVGDGIALERALLRPLKAAADLVIDTSRLSLAELRRLLVGHFAPAAESRLTLTITSFSFRHGLPREADLVLDVRFLANPHYVDALRPLTGLEPAVQAHVAADPGFAGFMERLDALLLPLLPRYRGEGKSYLTVAIGCTGGQHRSVFVAEALSERLRSAGWPVTTVHRDLPAALDSNSSGSPA
ncbi:MAG TPA: RNase adapter RapZ [Geminicoccaceae bacterium]|nr:RNase adapter RapZ [Geminicoccaceae bacterium]